VWTDEQIETKLIVAFVIFRTNIKRSTIFKFCSLLIRHSKLGTKLVARFRVNYEFFICGCIKVNTYNVIRRSLGFVTQKAQLLN
jgi:hypothetical protein